MLKSSRIAVVIHDELSIFGCKPYSSFVHRSRAVAPVAAVCCITSLMNLRRIPPLYLKQSRGLHRLFHVRHKCPYGWRTRIRPEVVDLIAKVSSLRKLFCESSSCVALRCAAPR
mmetsp:Transcript_26539/g.62111  ORF Transcript_26539/g.62111 Transcript_26539/m.62111 type:complete len:114 (+) Transcript_26539:31-372(+)